MYCRIDYLSDGQLPIYSTDGTAFIIGEEGQNVLAVNNSKGRVIFPLFTISHWGKSLDEVAQKIQVCLAERIVAIHNAIEDTKPDPVPNTIILVVRTLPIVNHPKTFQQKNVVTGLYECFMLCGIGAINSPATGGAEKFPFEDPIEYDFGSNNRPTDLQGAIQDIREALGIKGIS